MEMAGSDQATLSLAGSQEGDPNQPNLDKSKELIARQDTFAVSSEQPSTRRHSDSPQVGHTPGHRHVTPDEVFGPVSPRKGTGAANGPSPRTDLRYDSDFLTCEDKPKLPEVDPHLVRYYSRKPRKPHTKSKPSTSTEGPLRSSSQFARRQDNDVVEQLQEVPGPISSGSNSNESSTSDLRNDPQRNKPDRKEKGSGPSGTSRQRMSPWYDSHSRQSSSYYHGNVVDNNLTISEPILDRTLLKLFPMAGIPNQDGVEGSVSPTGSIPTAIATHGGGVSESDVISFNPVMWRVRPMEAAHKETLERELDLIVNAVEPRCVTGHLYRNGIITLVDVNQLSVIESQGDQAAMKLLVKLLQRRGDKAFQGFVDALRACDYPQVCERLLVSDRDITRGMLEDRVRFENKMAVAGTWQSNGVLRANSPFRIYSSSPYQINMVTNGTTTNPYHFPHLPYHNVPLIQQAMLPASFNAVPNDQEFHTRPIMLLNSSNGDGTYRAVTNPVLLHGSDQNPIFLHNAGTDPHFRYNMTPSQAGYPTTATGHQGYEYQQASQIPVLVLNGSVYDSNMTTRQMSPSTSSVPDDRVNTDSKQLEKYLNNLHAEVRALHDDVTALRKARPTARAGDDQPDGALRVPPLKLGTVESSRSDRLNISPTRGPDTQRSPTFYTVSNSDKNSEVLPRKEVERPQPGDANVKAQEKKLINTASGAPRRKNDQSQKASEKTAQKPSENKPPPKQKDNTQKTQKLVAKPEQSNAHSKPTKNVPKEKSKKSQTRPSKAKSTRGKPLVPLHTVPGSGAINEVKWISYPVPMLQSSAKWLTPPPIARETYKEWLD